ncbi:MAG: NAD(P)H-dependent oxidoreductase [Desulfobacterales bacterium]|nr:NAD(P)H-dependent oxidoreductase [Desulfobacterales bacterium]
MNISVILAHPRKKSFNHAIAQCVVDQLTLNGHKAFFHDLYDENFDPILPHHEVFADAELTPEIDAHCREIGSAEGIVIVHPNWWGQPPAILKGWVDRVMRPDIAYQFMDGDNGEGIPNGLLRAVAAVVFNTSNTPPQRESDEFGDPLQTLWQNCIFGLCGVRNFHRRNFAVMVTSTPSQRTAWLEEVTITINHYFPKG